MPRVKEGSSDLQVFRVPDATAPRRHKGEHVESTIWVEDLGLKDQGLGCKGVGFRV
jgi:hypothetical protein